MSGKILRVNMDELTVTFEDVPEKYKNLGGRGLTSTIVAEEVPPDCNSLGNNNKFVLAPGIITGTSAPSSGRVSAGCKSPLTGGIKEANAGTPFATTLGKLGIHAVIVEGSASNGYYLLKIDKDGAELQSADEWSGIGLYDAFKKLRDTYSKADIAGVGIASEMRGANASVAFNDPEGRPSRHAGRGGTGSVMAKRGLKFIVADRTGAPGKELKDEETFKKGKKKLLKALEDHDVTGEALPTYGTDVLINIINEAGGLPQKNFSAGSSDMSQRVSGEKKAEAIEKRRGERPHSCHPGCAINCSEIWVDEEGENPVGVLEYESVWALGPNCGIYDLDAVAELNRACNDIGMDTIETGGTIAVAMEGGVAEFGDSKKALELLEEVRKGSPLGRIIVNGTEFTGKAFGVTRIPTVKGQSMPAYDPRAIKGIGVTYATTPMGADHTAGYAIATEIMGVGGEADPFDVDKAELSRTLQTSTALIDSLGYCLFIAFAVLDIEKGAEGMVETMNGVLGTDYSLEDAIEIGKKILNTEREFNEDAGFTNKDDRLPEFMREEALPPHNEVFDVPAEELDKVFGEL